MRQDGAKSAPKSAQLGSLRLSLIRPDRLSRGGIVRGNPAVGPSQDGMLQALGFPIENFLRLVNDLFHAQINCC